jgi:hypothetical protein
VKHKFDKHQAELYWQSIGLVINNDKEMLFKARCIYKESLRLPFETKPHSVFKRKWYNELVDLIRDAWKVLLEEDPDLPKEPILCDGDKSYFSRHFNALYEKSNSALELWNHIYYKEE